jgi:hypothetical protein
MPGEAARIGISAFVAQDVDEYTVTALGVEPVNRLVKNCIVIHLGFVPRLRCRLPFNRAKSKNPARTVRN